MRSQIGRAESQEMPDSRFHSRTGPYRLDELAALIGAQIIGGEDSPLRDVAPLSAAGPGDISFFDNRLYLEAFRHTRAAACIIRADARPWARPGMALLVCDNPYLGYARVAEKFYPSSCPRGFEEAIHPRAVIAASADIGKGSRIGPGAVIGPGVRIGTGSVVGPHVVIGAGVEIGVRARIGSHVSIEYALIGDRVVIHSGVRIGQAGFGFATDHDRVHHRVPQLGRVIIDDDVDIGANTTIDRGSGPDTRIGGRLYD